MIKRTGGQEILFNQVASEPRSEGCEGARPTSTQRKNIPGRDNDTYKIPKWEVLPVLCVWGRESWGEAGLERKGKLGEESGVYSENAEKPLESFKQGVLRSDLHLKRLLCEGGNTGRFSGGSCTAEGLA